jgi:hypothetical protein
MRTVIVTIKAVATEARQSLLPEKNRLLRYSSIISVYPMNP